MRMLAFAFALPLLVVAGVTKAQTFTGCLTSGGTIAMGITDMLFVQGVTQ